MKWTEEVQLRFNDLRQKELAGTLNTQEKDELATLFTVIEADEKRYLAGAIIRMREEMALTQAQAEKHQQNNVALAEIIRQQEQLIADARRWLVEFEHRHKMIRQSYTQLTGEVLA